VFSICDWLSFWHLRDDDWHSFSLLVLGSIFFALGHFFWCIDMHCSTVSSLCPLFTLTHSTWTTSMGLDLVLRFGLQLVMNIDAILGWSMFPIRTPQQASRTRNRGLPSQTTSRIALVCGHSGLGKRKRRQRRQRSGIGPISNEIRLTWCSTVHRGGSGGFRSRSIFA
jgi:hypothetical protein